MPIFSMLPVPPDALGQRCDELCAADFVRGPFDLRVDR
jgi:hypothetical protein